MPPFRRFWLVYALFGFVVVSLCVGVIILLNLDDVPSNSWVLFGGVWVAALAIAANSWTQWRSNSVAHAFDGLQTLRTDREYLINAYVVRQTIGALGKPLGGAARRAFEDTGAASEVDAPSFRDASLFVLNQYEFLAAGVRSGSVDYALVKTTMRGPLINVVQTYAAQINGFRAGNPRSFDNLLWLYRRFRAMPPFDRGPIP